MRSGIERGEGAELFRDDERRVVWQHDAAGADAYCFRAPGDVADHDGGGGTGDAGHVVVLGEPEAAVVPGFRVLGEVEGVSERVRGGGAGDDWREVEDGEGDHFLFIWCFGRFRAMGHFGKGFGFCADGSAISMFVEGFGWGLLGGFWCLFFLALPFSCWSFGLSLFC